MPTYVYLCEPCDVEIETFRKMADGPDDSIACPECTVPTSKRVFSVAVAKPFIPHYNKSVGRYVRSMAEFKSYLQQASEKQEARTGIATNYVAVDPADGVDAHAISGEGLDNTHRQRRRITQDKYTGKSVDILA